MKNQVWHFVILLTLVTPRVYGQSLTARGAVSDENVNWRHSTRVLHGNSLPSEQAADLSIGYYDSLLPSLDISVPTLVGTNVVAEYGERIAMPGENGYLDSVQITLDAISGDSIEIDLFPDTLFATGAGDYHLMNIFDPNAQAPTLGYIYASQIQGRTTVTLPVPHMEIQSQNFWVALTPNFNSNTGGFTNTFVLVGDSESIVPRTTDNSHSGFLAELSTGQILSAVYDSTFLNASGTPIYSNFYITAFVSSSPSSVSSSQRSSSVSVFPNPASNFLQIQGATGISNVELLDLLGRPLLSSTVDGTGRIDVSQLRQGSYEAVIHTGNGVVSTPVIIQR